MDDLQNLPDEDLWSLTTQVSGRDRIDVLFELGHRAARRGDHDRATTLWQEVEDAARKLVDPALAAEALRLQGAAAFYSDDLDAAIDRYERASQEHLAAGLNQQAAGCLWCLADCYRVLGEPQRQLAAATRSREMAELEQARGLAGDSCYLQALALRALDRDQEAVDVCAAGREHFRAAQRADQVAVIDDLAVSVHLDLGNLDEALELARGCLVLARMSATRDDDSYARYRLAEVLLRHGQAQDALEQADEAQAGYRRNNDLVGAARCERLRAEALCDLNEASRALTAFADARVLFDATGKDVDALRCETRRAIVLHYVGDFAGAARANERLVDQYQQLPGEEDSVRWSVVRWLDNLQEEQRHDVCVSVAQSYLGLWPEGASDDASHREFLGLYALALENTGRVGQATAIANHVIAHTPAREAGGGTAFCYEIRGRSHLAENEAAAGQDFSHAIALHLVEGRVDRARDLARYFLPVDAGSRDRVTSSDGPAVLSAGHG